LEDAVTVIQEGTGAEVPKLQAEELSRAISADLTSFTPVRHRPIEEASAPEELAAIFW
jgi:hypothetical protein